VAFIPTYQRIHHPRCGVFLIPPVLALTQSLFRGHYTKELVWSKVRVVVSTLSFHKLDFGRSFNIRSKFVSTKLCEIPLLYKKTCNTHNSCSTFLKLTKLDKQCFYGLFKIVIGFGKFGDLPNFVKSCFDTTKLVKPIPLFLHS